MTGLVVQEPEADGHNHGDQNQHGDAQDVLGGNAGEVTAQAADGVGAGVNQADAVNNLLHTQGGDEGLHLQVADHQAVHQAEDGADGDDDGKDGEQGQLRHIGVETAGVASLLGQNGGQAGGEASHTAGAQVVAGGDQAAGNAQRDDVADGDVLQGVDQVAGAEEFRLHDAHRNDDDQHQDNDGVVRDPAFYLFAGDFLGILHVGRPP